MEDLHGVEFEWVGSAYALSSTAFLPLSGGLAQVSNFSKKKRFKLTYKLFLGFRKKGDYLVADPSVLDRECNVWCRT